VLVSVQPEGLAQAVGAGRQSRFQPTGTGRRGQPLGFSMRLRSPACQSNCCTTSGKKRCTGLFVISIVRWVAEVIWNGPGRPRLVAFGIRVFHVSGEPVRLPPVVM